MGKGHQKGEKPSQRMHKLDTPDHEQNKPPEKIDIQNEPSPVQNKPSMINAQETLIGTISVKNNKDMYKKQPKEDRKGDFQKQMTLFDFQKISVQAEQKEATKSQQTIPTVTLQTEFTERTGQRQTVETGQTELTVERLTGQVVLFPNIGEQHLNQVRITRTQQTIPNSNENQEEINEQQPMIVSNPVQSSRPRIRHIILRTPRRRRRQIRSRFLEPILEVDQSRFEHDDEDHRRRRRNQIKKMIFKK